MAACALVGLLTLGACSTGDRYSAGYGTEYRAVVIDGDYRDRRDGRVYRDYGGDGVPDRFDRFPRNPNRR